MNAYRFEGSAREFPAHFHEHYTVGYMVSGKRKLYRGDKEYWLCGGDMVIFNPRDSHACTQSEGVMDFKGLNIEEETLREISAEITGSPLPPRFMEDIIKDAEAAACFSELHKLVMSGNAGENDKEALLPLAEIMIGRYLYKGIPVPEYRREVERACEFIKENYAERITLGQICRHAGLSKSALLRAFAGEMGITPYCYLENIRVCRAKELLEAGVPPAEAALGTGFYDQSHFTAYFTRFIGFSPKEYQTKIAKKGEAK